MGIGYRYNAKWTAKVVLIMYSKRYRLILLKLINLYIYVYKKKLFIHFAVNYKFVNI